LTNAALERAGVEAAVAHQSLKARGHRREACIYTTAQDKAHVETRREVLRRDDHPWEQSLALGAWQMQKVREQITDLSRETMVDRIRDRFWLTDESPARVQERQASVWRTIHREHARTGRPLQGPRVEVPRPSLAELSTQLTQLQARLARLSQDAPQAGAALNVWLYQEKGVAVQSVLKVTIL
jgi:hypothetical protein